MKGGLAFIFINRNKRDSEMKASKLTLRGCFCLFILLLSFQYSWALDRTSTGFYYPTGTNSLGDYAGWLASGCNENTEYFTGEYHIGFDIEAALGDLVYPISYGKVVSISSSGWGVGNVGVLIKHLLSDGTIFLALYGHVVSDINVGDNVLPYKSFASIGDWSSGIHLHFGIYPGSSIPASPWGKMPCSSWPSTNGFVDPIGWIENQEPMPGALGRIDGQNPIYWLQNWKAYHVLDEPVIQSMFGLPGWSMDEVYEYPDDVLEINPSGHLLPVGAFQQGPVFISTSPGSNGLLIKFTDDPNVYLIEGGQRKWITSAQVFEELGYDWNDVITVSEAIINQIQEGEPIYSGYGNWIKRYTNAYDLEGEALVKTSDGGFLMVGNLVTPTEEGAFLLKLDKDGAIKSLKKRYADVNSYRLYCALEVSSNEYLLAGTHTYNYVGQQGLIIKVDSNGNKIGEKEYPGIAAIRVLKKTSDGKYIMKGNGNDVGHVVIKLDENLVPIWRYAIDGHNNWFKGFQIFEMTSGSYIFTAGNKIVKVLPNGEHGWQKNYCDESSLVSIVSLDSIYPSIDGQFLVAGRVRDNYNFIVFKINDDGTSSNAKFFQYVDGQSHSVIIDSVIELPNQDIQILSEDRYNGSPRQISLLRLSPNGSFKWNKEFGYFDERYTTPKDILSDGMNHTYLLGKIRKETYVDDTLLIKLGHSGIVNSACDFVTDVQLEEQNLDLIDIETSDAMDITNYASIEPENVETFQTNIIMCPVCQGSALHDQTISQIPFGLVPELTISDSINLSASLSYCQLYLGIRALHNLLLNWPGSEMKLEVFKPDGTLYGEYQDTTPPISLIFRILKKAYGHIK
jgi:hypothetical protein